MMDWTATLIVGAAVLAGAVGAYLRKPDQWIFPVVMALVGVVLCGANAVKATFGNGTSIEINRPLVESADANFRQITAQQATIDKLAEGLGTVQDALSTLTEAVRKQAAAVAAQQVATNREATASGAPPVPAASVSGTAAAVTAAASTEQQLQSIRSTRINLDRLLTKSRDAGNDALIANRRLKTAVAIGPAG